MKKELYIEAVAQKDLYKEALRIAIFDLLPECARIPMCGKCPASTGFCKQHMGPICDDVLFDYFIKQAKENVSREDK